jgi:hypothetical protein
MKLAGSRLLLIAAAAGIVAATATPAAAWVCTAKNARGAFYTSVGILPALVCERALAKCRVDSIAPRTCRVVSSHP